MPLSITRKENESVLLRSASGELIEITLVRTKGDRARIAFSTDNEFRIIRTEIMSETERASFERGDLETKKFLEQDKAA